MSDRVDCAVIGAGVIGLAIARALANAGREILVLERNAGIGEETSSRNSEVIHAGIYYPTDSLKARLCVAGKHALYEYCAQRNIPHARTGKLIVATDDTQLQRLDALASQAEANGVGDLLRLDRDALVAREPEVAGIAALYSPSTGIVDSHALMNTLQGDLEAKDGIVATHSTVSEIEVLPGGIRLAVDSGGEVTELEATTVINAAGLQAGILAAECSGCDDYVSPSVRFAKGTYFIYEGRSPFTTLVYPLPVAGGLGIHATLDLGGKLRFGPDVEWVDTVDYAVDPGRRRDFAESIRHYWPNFDERLLVPGYAGIRPKLGGPGDPPADFRIDIAASGTRRQLVHLLGMESPGLTASLAIGDEVHRRLAATASA